jgi:hypothetical protein
MIELKNALMEKLHVKVYHEDENQMAYGAPHNYQFKNAGSGEYLGEVKFQKGPIKDVGINGVSNEVLLCMVLERLQCFQNGDYACRENALAITSIEEALLWMKKRTLDREARGVEGTNKK